MIKKVVEPWRRVVAGGERPEATRRSSTPRSAARPLRRCYPPAGAQTLPGDLAHGAFHYTKQLLAGDVAMLEFETTVDGNHVNGVEIIRCDDPGRIVEFRVMIRPLQAINAMHEQMRAMLASVQPQLHRDGGEEHAVREPAAQHP